MKVGYFFQECNYKLKNRRKISKWIEQTASAEGFSSVKNLCIVLCSDNYLLEVNRQFLGHDYFTDVITFDETDITTKTISGDILISVDTVADNAKTYGVTTHKELMRIIIHGVLHLCGYKDKSPKDAKIMRSKEDFYLAQAEQEGLL